MYNNGAAAPAWLRELCVGPSSRPCVALSSARTNETVKQRSMILIDPGATCRQLGYILPEECPFRPNTSTAAAAAAAAAAAVVVVA